MMKITENVSLKDFSYWKIGGKAKYLIEVQSLEEILLAKEFLSNKELPAIIIGNTTNLLFSSIGLNGGLIKLGKGFSSIDIGNELVRVGASAYVPNVVRQCINNGLKGLEHLIGVPATTGGAVYMNGGSQRKSISENVISVTSVNSMGDVIVRYRGDCNFSYRKSIFQENNEVVVSIDLKLKKGSKKNLRRQCLDILRTRNNKFPRKLPSCGSVFVSNPSMYAEFGPPGKIIESVGLKGIKKGGASISKKHANFIVNDGDASSDDVLFLINLARQKVYEQTGYSLETEAIYINQYGQTVPAHLSQ